MMYKVVVSQLAKFIRSLDLRKCEDRLAGLISPEGVNSKCFSYQKYRTSTLPKIIFILESPHKDEYETTPLPARNRTGSAIRRSFPKFILESIECDYELLLVNAIQYQCSLGVDTAAFRDEVFKSAWHNFGRKSFEKRLKYYFNEGDIVVNACTKGAKKPYLREDVEESIFNVLQRKSDFRITHPSSWSRSKNGVVRW